MQFKQIRSRQKENQKLFDINNKYQWDTAEEAQAQDIVFTLVGLDK